MYVRALGLSSSSSIPYQCMCWFTVCLCCVCCSVVWDSCPWCFLPSTPTAGFVLQGLFQQAATLALGRPVGVLAPWGVTVVAAPGPLGHLASICDVGVNLILSYLFGIFRQAGSVRLLKAGVNVGPINDNKATLGATFVTLC